MQFERRKFLFDMVKMDGNTGFYYTSAFKRP